MLPALLLGAALSIPVVPTAEGLDPQVEAVAVKAWTRAHEKGLVERPIVTVIDYRLPSSEPRLWVLDLDHGTVLFHERVAHGRGSGETNATRFGDEPGSLASSVGVFRTAETYQGKNGYSLALDGLEPGFNARARERAIVMHGAPYVSDAFVKLFGRAGRSWGCPALDRKVARTVIDAVKGATLLVAYANDPDWLARSTFVGPDSVGP